MGNLEHYRKKVDLIDKKIVRLLQSRFMIAKRISVFKKLNKIKIVDRKRESKILSNAKKLSKQHQQFMIKVFKDIIDYSKKIQSK